LKSRASLLVAIIVLFSSTLAASELNTPPRSMSVEKQALIVELMDVVGTVKVMQATVDRLLSGIRSKYSWLNDAQWRRVSKALDVAEEAKLFIPVYDRHLSEDDLRQLLVFYKSPVGQRVLNAMPQILQEVGVVVREWSEKKASEIIRELQREEEDRRRPSQAPTPRHAQIQPLSATPNGTE
jgi:hypothetical protein